MQCTGEGEWKGVPPPWAAMLCCFTTPGGTLCCFHTPGGTLCITQVECLLVIVLILINGHTIKDFAFHWWAEKVIYDPMRAGGWGEQGCKGGG